MRQLTELEVANGLIVARYIDQEKRGVSNGRYNVPSITQLKICQVIDFETFPSVFF